MISLFLLIFVMFYYPTGDDNTWAGVGILLLSVIIGLIGVLLSTIGLFMRLREKHLEKQCESK